MDTEKSFMVAIAQNGWWMVRGEGEEDSEMGKEN